MGGDISLNRRFSAIVNDSGLGDWELFDRVTRFLKCVIIVGAGNHYGITPTVMQIAQKELDFEKFRIIRPYFDYEIVEDHEFEELLQGEHDSFYRQTFVAESTSDQIVFCAEFPNRYVVKGSFAGAFGSAIRLNFENFTANRINPPEDEFYHNCYRDILVSCNNNWMAYYDFDFEYKFPYMELKNRFPNHLNNGDCMEIIIINPLEFFYQYFDRRTVRWLNLNQDGILEGNVSAEMLVSYHGNVQAAERDLVLPGYTGAIDLETKHKAECFINDSQVVIVLGYSFSDYDYDLFGMLDIARVSRFIIFDLNENGVYRNLKAIFPKATIEQRHTSLPLVPDFDYTNWRGDISEACHKFRSEKIADILKELNLFNDKKKASP